MKKILTLILVGSTVLACHRKTISSTETIIISNKNVEEKPKTEVPKKDISNTDLTVAGKTVYATRCNRCHSLKATENFTIQQWENILKSMIPKARLNADEAKQVTAYVMANAKK